VNRKTEKARLEELYGTDEAMGVAPDPDDDDIAKLPDGSSAAICTNVAIYVASKEKECELKYFTDETNPESPISKDYGGHDFAVVNGFIVDPWVSQTETYSKKSVFDTEDPADAEEIAKIYGDRSKWSKLELNKNEHMSKLPKRLMTLHEMVVSKVVPKSFTKAGGNKLVSKDGQPLVLWHGSRMRSTAYTKSASDIGYQFTSSETQALKDAHARGGEEVHKYRLRAENPLKVNFDMGAKWSDPKAWELTGLLPEDWDGKVVDGLKSLGYDAVIFSGKGHNGYIVFDDDQIMPETT
jgi:hypothetical protein